MSYTTIDLPIPPSVNKIWRHSRLNGKVYLDTRYKSWKRVADNLYLQHKRDWQPIKGNFRARMTIALRYRGKTDIDSRQKALLDWLQRVELIENDKLCDGLTVEWGYAPEGVRVVLIPVSTSVRRAA